MARILRKRRVGTKDTENYAVAKSKVKELKTVAPTQTPTRAVFMDKTNVMKEKSDKPKIVALNFKDGKNSALKSKKTEEKQGKVTRRRGSSKENVKETNKSSKGEAESKPLGDKTNVGVPTKSPQGAASADAKGGADVTSKDGGSSPIKDLISSEDTQSEYPSVRRPPRNAAKSKEGRISALRSTRTSKDRGTETQTSSKLEAASVPLQTYENDPPESNRRPRRGVKGTITKTDMSSTENVISQNKLSSVQGKKSSTFHEQKITDSPSSESGSVASDGEVQPIQNESPLRKLPPRNAAKFEKGWIAALRSSRNSKENESGSKKSPQKPKSKPLDDQTTASESDVGKDVVKTGKELAKSKKMAEKVSTESDEEKDTVPELPEIPERQFGSRKTQLGSSSQQVENLATPECDSGEPKHRGLKDFESRIAAKLGIDMNESVSGKNSKVSGENVKELRGGTSSRQLRKRGTDKNVKTYTEAELSENGIPSKTPGPKKPKKSPSKDASHAARTDKMEGGKAISAVAAVSDEKVSQAEVSFSCARKGKITSGKASDLKGSTSKLASSSSKPTEPEPQPGCSWYATPHRKSGGSKEPNSVKKTPLVPPSSSLFSIFKKPETHKRSPSEKKIFVSSAKQPSESGENKHMPVYGNPNMTPLKRTTDLPVDKKDELYEFEVDENEPKPKKRHKPIMKIQRVRAVKRKQPKVYEPDPETERRVLRNLDLSPSVLEEFRATKTRKIVNAAGNVAAQPSPRPSVASTADDHHPDTFANDPPGANDHGFDFASEPMSSPCRDFGQSTPMRDAPSMFLDDSRDKFGRLSVKAYSPVKAKDSPIPVLMAEYNNDPVRNSNSSRRSVVSNASCMSGASGGGRSIYHDDHDISASTPVKVHTNDTTYRPRQEPEPLELNLSNCFGFDEPEIVEEPLVSPIKSTLHVPAPETSAPIRPIPILKSKPPLMLPPPVTPAVDVDQVIKQLRFEVGDDSTNNSANISVYDDSEITLKPKSPIKRYFQPKEDHKHKANKSPKDDHKHGRNRSMDESAQEEGNDSISPVKITNKMPRLSYERPSKLRKKKVVEPVYRETSESESAESSEESDAEGEPEPAEEIFKFLESTPKKEARKRKRKGMTKKEEEELEKWAQMFNSQCNQIDSTSLVVE